MYSTSPHSSLTSADVGSGSVRQMQVGRHQLLIRQQLPDNTGGTFTGGRRATPKAAYGCEVEMEDEESHAAAQEAQRRTAAVAARDALADTKRLAQHADVLQGLTVSATPAVVKMQAPATSSRPVDTAEVRSLEAGAASESGAVTAASSASATAAATNCSEALSIATTATADVAARIDSQCIISVTAAPTAAAVVAAAVVAPAVARLSCSSPPTHSTVMTHRTGMAQSALADVGLMVWQSGFVLADFLLRHPPFGGWGDVSCVDLGTAAPTSRNPILTGTGVVGIALSLEGCRTSILTDLPHIISLTQLNVKANCQSCHADQYPTVLQYCWGSPAGDVISANGGSKPDLITGADIIFDPQYHDDLLNSLHLLSAPHTITYLGHRLRHAGEEGFVAKALARGFAVETVPDSELHEDYSLGEYQVLRLCCQDAMEE